jgi:hypothetical protein
MLHNARRTADGEIRLNKVCISCELKIPGKMLQPVAWRSEPSPPTFWVHPDCIADYYR